MSNWQIFIAWCVWNVLVFVVVDAVHHWQRWEWGMRAWRTHVDTRRRINHDNLAPVTAAPCVAPDVCWCVRCRKNAERSARLIERWRHQAVERKR